MTITTNNLESLANYLGFCYGNHMSDKLNDLIENHRENIEECGEDFANRVFAWRVSDVLHSDYRNFIKNEFGINFRELTFEDICTLKEMFDKDGAAIETKGKELYGYIGTYALGTFYVDSGKLMVSDPCYDIGTWCQGSIDNVPNGTWNAKIIRTDENSWGVRCAELHAYHESTNGLFLDWIKSDIRVGVDSGQAGIFDYAKYPQGESTGKYGDKDSFYGKVCDITLDSKLSSGVIEFGTVSSSGYGDGGYNCYYATDKNGKVIAVKIVFIGDESEEDYE